MRCLSLVLGLLLKLVTRLIEWFIVTPADLRGYLPDRGRHVPWELLLVAWLVVVVLRSRRTIAHLGDFVILSLVVLWKILMAWVLLSSVIKLSGKLGLVTWHFSVVVRHASQARAETRG